MDAYYQQWGMEDDGDPVVSGWWTAALFEKASFGCLAWKGDELFGAAVGHARSMKNLELGSSWKPSAVWAQEAVDKLGAEATALLDEISTCNRRLAQRAQAICGRTRFSVGVAQSPWNGAQQAPSHGSARRHACSRRSGICAFHR